MDYISINYLKIQALKKGLENVKEATEETYTLGFDEPINDEHVYKVMLFLLNDWIVDPRVIFRVDKVGKTVDENMAIRYAHLYLVLSAIKFVDEYMINSADVREMLIAELLEYQIYGHEEPISHILIMAPDYIIGFYNSLKLGLDINKGLHDYIMDA